MNELKTERERERERERAEGQREEESVLLSGRKELVDILVGPFIHEMLVKFKN